MFEVIIIGSGPAGVSAAIFCARANVNTLVLGKPKKSQLVLAHKIENYFGFPKSISGSELLELGIKQAKRFKAKFLGENVVSATQKGKGFEVVTEKNKKMQCKALIIATGIPITSSGIKNEEKFVGKGLSYCVSCDGPFFKNKKVCIIGNSNHAADEALDLLHYTKNISIISDAKGFNFSMQFQSEINERKIKLIDKDVVEFAGKNFLKNVIFSDGKKMVFDGVFMACGTSSAIDFAREMGVIIEGNTIVVDERNMTNVKGVFSAGNSVGRCRQVAANVGGGANAAMNAIKFIGQKKIYLDYGAKK